MHRPSIMLCNPDLISSGEYIYYPQPFFVHYIFNVFFNEQQIYFYYQKLYTHVVLEMSCLIKSRYDMKSMPACYIIGKLSLFLTLRFFNLHMNVIRHSQQIIVCKIKVLVFANIKYLNHQVYTWRTYLQLNGTGIHLSIFII